MVISIHYHCYARTLSHSRNYIIYVSFVNDIEFASNVLSLTYLKTTVHHLSKVGDMRRSDSFPALLPQIPGQLKIHPAGLVWKRPGGKVVDVAKPDIQQVTWLRVPKGYQLALRLAGGSKVKFAGFREQVSPPSLSFFF